MSDEPACECERLLRRIDALEELVRLFDRAVRGRRVDQTAVLKEMRRLELGEESRELLLGPRPKFDKESES